MHTHYCKWFKSTQALPYFVLRHRNFATVFGKQSISRGVNDMAKYKMICERAEEDIWCLDGKLSDVKEYVERLIEKYGDDACMDIERDGYDCYVELYVEFERQESDKERDKRLAVARKEREKKAKEKAVQEERERKELARLQKKYGES